MCIEDLACSFWRRNWFEIELWETHDMINPTSGWGQCSSVHEPLCLEVCLVQCLALKSMICAASSSMSSRRNEGMIWWSRLIIGLSWLSDDFYFYCFFLLADCWIFENLQGPRPSGPTVSDECAYYVHWFSDCFFEKLWKTWAICMWQWWWVYMVLFSDCFFEKLWRTLSCTQLWRALFPCDSLLSNCFSVAPSFSRISIPLEPFSDTIPYPRPYVFHTILQLFWNLGSLHDLL